MDILLLITKFSLKKDIAFNSCKGYVLFHFYLLLLFSGRRIDLLPKNFSFG